MRPVLAKSLSPFLVAAALVLLSGCAGTDSDDDAAGTPTVAPSSSAPSSTPSASGTPEPSATSSPSPSFPDLVVADPSTWLITFQGIGPIRIGDTLATLRPTMEAVYPPTDQGGLCAIWDTGAAFSPVVPLGMAETDPIAWTALFGGTPPTGDGTPKTAEGIGIGSTADEVRAAYPDATEEQNTYGPNLAITDNGGMYIDFVLSPEGIVDGVVVIDTPRAPDEYCA